MYQHELILLLQTNQITSALVIIKCLKLSVLFHERQTVKGSDSHACSRWFSRKNPFKSNVKGQKAEVDFQSLCHTVATEMKQAVVISKYAAQILGHSSKLVGAIAVIAESSW